VHPSKATVSPKAPWEGWHKRRESGDLPELFIFIRRFREKKLNVLRLSDVFWFLIIKGQPFKLLPVFVPSFLSL
jgi:hypothetical protein